MFFKHALGMIRTKGRIVNIEKIQNRTVYIKQGVQGKDQYKYNNYSGGNGTYVTGGEYFGTSLNVKIYVYDLKRCYTVDVYDDIKRLTGKTRISAKLLEKIENHQGEKVDVFVNEYMNQVMFDPSILIKS